MAVRSPWAGRAMPHGFVAHGYVVTENTPEGRAGEVWVWFDGRADAVSVPVFKLRHLSVVERLADLVS